MAKKKPDALTADEAVEVRTLEAKVQAEEAAERTVNERVAEVFSAPEPAEVGVVDPDNLTESVDAAFPVASEPVDARTPEQIEADTWLSEASAAREVYIAGNAISPDELKRLLGQAIGLVTRYRA